MVRWIILINKAECKFLLRYFVVTTSHNVRHLKNDIDVRFHYRGHNVSRYFSPSQGQSEGLLKFKKIKKDEKVKQVKKLGRQKLTLSQAVRPLQLVS